MLLRNVIIYNAHHDKDYFNKKGVLLIEDINNKKIELDLESMTDITNCDYLEIKIIKGKTKYKYLFQNELYNGEKK